MKTSTLTKIGLVTLVSCSAHAALLSVMPAKDSSAKIQGGSVSVHFSSAGGKSGTPATALREAVTEHPETEMTDAIEAAPEQAVEESKPEIEEQDTKPVQKPEPVKAAEHIPVRPHPASVEPPKPTPKPVADQIKHPAPPQELSEIRDAHPPAPDTEVDKADAEADGHSEGDTDVEAEGDDTGLTGSDEVNTSDRASAQGSEIVTSQATSSAAGNAAETNYKGEVMRHLSRVRRPRASSPGSAFVSFTLTLRGQIEDISISKSSGSGRFDRDALTVVKRAAPYPKPPHGVNRTFVVEIEGQ
tara:strand:+ start:1140 stop:2042 length:903 start_codon:yes stop_codon:yes gene_type:complete